MMRFSMRLTLAVLALAPVPALAQAEPSPAQLAAAEAHTMPLTIHARHRALRFSVEVARSADEQELGLMYRRRMGARHGMIFPMEPPRVANFWMKNTYIPLDIMFIRADGTIASIAANCTPLSLGLIGSTEPVAAVLELTGGAAAREGIRAGDRVRWRGGVMPLRRAPHRG